MDTHATIVSILTGPVHAAETAEAAIEHEAEVFAHWCRAKYEQAYGAVHALFPWHQVASEIQGKVNASPASTSNDTAAESSDRAPGASGDGPAATSSAGESTAPTQ